MSDSEFLTETTWGEIVSIKQGKYVAKSDLAPDRTIRTPVPTVGANGILGYVNRATLDRRVALVTCRGSNCGLIQFPREPVWVSNNAMSLDAGSEEDNTFVHYLALNTNFSDVVSGSAQPQITAGPLKAKRVLVPPKEHWPSIAATLAALDDKVESNRRKVRAAEELAFSYFKSWSSMAPKIEFGEVAELVTDRVKVADIPPKGTYLGLEHFATDGRGLMNTGSTSFITSTALSFEAGDVLYGKLRPYFRKIARPGFNGLCTSELWVLRARPGHTQSSVHAIAQSPEFSDLATASSGGTRMPRADWNLMAKTPVPDMRSVLDSAREKLLEVLWANTCDLRDENLRLTALRDVLLPALLSGKIRTTKIDETAQETLK